MCLIRKSRKEVHVRCWLRSRSTLAPFSSEVLYARIKSEARKYWPENVEMKPKCDKLEGVRGLEVGVSDVTTAMPFPSLFVGVMVVRREHVVGGRTKEAGGTQLQSGVKHV